MKTYLLTLLVALLAFAGQAWAQDSPDFKQQFRYSEVRDAKAATLAGPGLDLPVAGQQGVAIPPGSTPISLREGTPFAVPLGSSYNIYSVVSEGPNALSYHPEINSMVFCHRQNFPSPGGSGIISFDVSTDGGMTWDTTTKQVTPALTTADGIAINGNRYPNGCIYNPPGNMDPDNAKFVSAGAALWTDPDFGNGWGWDFVASADLDGSNFFEDYYSLPDTNSYLPMGMVYTPSGDIWYANIRREQNLPHQLYNPITVNKLVYNSGSGAFDHSTTTLPLNYAVGIDSFAANPRIEFAPDGMTGYAVVSGIDGDDTEIYPSVKPIVWKTNDGGETWEKQPRIEYQLLDTLLAYTIPVDADGDGESDDPMGDSPRIPYIAQFDITVDGDGNLHVFAEMFSSSSIATNGDEFGFIWTGPFATELFHLISTDDGWEDYRVDDWYNEDSPIGMETVEVRPQASRTPDGQHVFFTYSKTFYFDPENTEELLNNAPDIYGYAYRLSDGYIVPPRNFGLVPGTVFDDFMFTDVATQGYFHMTAPVSIQNGEFWDQELPIVYGVPRAVEDDLEPIDYYFLRSAGFDDEEYQPRDGMVDVKEPNELLSFEVLPNPAQDWAQVTLALEAGTRFDLNLYSTTGQYLQAIAEGIAFGQQTVNLPLAQLQAGVYYLRLQTDTGASARKLILR